MKLSQLVSEEYSEGKGSTFTHQGKCFLVDDLLALAKSKSTIDFDLAKLQWMTDQPSDADRVANANTNIPVIVIEYEPNKWVTLDGFHRVCKAIAGGSPTIAAKIVTERDLDTLKQI